MTHKYYCTSLKEAPSDGNRAGYKATLVVNLDDEDTIAPPYDPVHFTDGDEAENFPAGAVFAPGSAIVNLGTDAEKVYVLSPEYAWTGMTNGTVLGGE